MKKCNCGALPLEQHKSNCELIVTESLIGERERGAINSLIRANGILRSAMYDIQEHERYCGWIGCCSQIAEKALKDSALDGKGRL